MIGFLFLLAVIVMSAAQVALPTWIACSLLLLLICLFLNAEPTRFFTNDDGRMREWNGRERAPLTFGMLFLQQLAACGFCGQLGARGCCGHLNALSAYKSCLYLDQTHSEWEQFLCIGHLLMYFVLFLFWDIALVPIAVARAALQSPMLECILLCAPARCSWWEIGLGMLACFVLAFYGMIQNTPLPKNPWSIAMGMALVGAWVGPILCALLKSLGVGESDPEMFLRLLPFQPWLMSPLNLGYCQDSVAACFRDGQDIRNRLRSYSVIACYHDGILLSLNNRTLYSALYNGIEEIAVVIVKKPFDWDQRFSAKPPYTFVRVRTNRHDESGHYIAHALPLPAAAFPGAEPSGPTGLMVLEVDRLINSKNRDNQESSLKNLLKKYCPQLHLEEVDGERSYARVRIRMEDEALIREVLKAIGKERRKHGMSIRVVEGSRIFESPRF